LFRKFCFFFFFFFIFFIVFLFFIRFSRAFLPFPGLFGRGRGVRRHSFSDSVWGFVCSPALVIGFCFSPGAPPPTVFFVPSPVCLFFGVVLGGGGLAPVAPVPLSGFWGGPVVGGVGQGNSWLVFCLLFWFARVMGVAAVRPSWSGWYREKV